MIETYNYEGKNKEELYKKMQEDLSLELNDLFLIESEEEAKLFKSKKFFIKVIKKSDFIQHIKNYVNEFGKLFGLEIKSEVSIKDDGLNVILASDNNSILIGKDGKTLTSLQLIIKQMTKRILETNYRVNVDVGGYKNKKISNLEFEIKKIAKDVLYNKIEVKLDPMNSYERRIVHNLISKYEELESKSEGSEPNRYIVIKPKN